MNAQIVRSLAELESALPFIAAAPAAEGPLTLIVRRPGVDLREVLDRAEFDPRQGLVGDSWKDRPSSRTGNGTPHPDMQINIMSVRVIQAIAADAGRWPLAGDQLFVDLDLSAQNVPPGTRLLVGSAVLEVTDQPHTGCGKFAQRFGLDALKFVNSPRGRRMNLRGVNARVIQAGAVERGEMIARILPNRRA